MKITIGIDPSSKAHGVALYEDGILTELYNSRLMEFSQKIIEYKLQSKDSIIVSVENVLANKSIYARNDQANTRKQGKVGQNVGMNKQSMIELIRMLEYYEIPHILIKPSRDNWADDKNKFERITGWTGRSNKDTRSAAYFGFLAI